MSDKRKHGDDLRAASQLAVEATKRVTALVEAMHREIVTGPSWLGKPLAAPARWLTKLAYGPVRHTAGLVGTTLDAALAALAPLLGESAPGIERETVRAVLNGVLGDYLEETKNTLAILMRTRVTIEPKTRLLVLVHGSSMTDLGWKRGGHDHGERLAEALGCGLAYVHYNSGLHVSTNGAMLAAELDKLNAKHTFSELVLIGHSMGGLVARSACLAGDQNEWRKKLVALVTIGTPHHGAPLERGGSWMHALLEVSRYSAPLSQLARIRSAGITDLRFGNVRGEDWLGRNRFELGDDPRTPLPLPSNVKCYAIAGTLSVVPDGAPRSDGMVPVNSALGLHGDPARALNFPVDHQMIAYATSHLGLLSDARVYTQLRQWLSVV
jgi:pimeloyl-ACP methyl ester carboxylesterase